MQLVACGKCHTQYDVSGVAADAIACSCGERVVVESLAVVEAEVHRCSSCGALAASDAASCDYCGSAIVRDRNRLSLICPECFAANEDEARFCGGCGVRFSPQPLPQDAPDVDCPACGVRLAARAVADTPLHECPECSGLWVPGDRFDELVRRAAERGAAGGRVGAAQAPRVTGANPARQSVQYRKCPACQSFMQRRNFQKTSGVIIDRCREHGTWLDADELERIAGFLLSGGRPDASAFLREQEARDEAEYHQARRVNSAMPASIGRMGGTSVRTSDTSSGGGVAGSLLGLLVDLLD